MVKHVVSWKDTMKLFSIYIFLILAFAVLAVAINPWFGLVAFGFLVASICFAAAYITSDCGEQWAAHLPSPHLKYWWGFYFLSKKAAWSTTVVTLLTLYTYDAILCTVIRFLPPAREANMEQSTITKLAIAQAVATFLLVVLTVVAYPWRVVLAFFSATASTAYIVEYFVSKKNEENT